MHQKVKEKAAYSKIHGNTLHRKLRLSATRIEKAT